MTAIRFLYRLQKDKHWNVLDVAQMPADNAKRLVAEWNRRDRPAWVWRFEGCQPNDIDHPEREGEL